MCYAATAMLPALVSAAVAFTVLALTQWIIHRREQSRFLLTKLEKLYLMLLRLGERNVQRFEGRLRVTAGQLYNEPAQQLSFDQRIAGDLLEKIDLLMQFYFPSLGADLEKIFAANRLCIKLLETPT